MTIIGKIFGVTPEKFGSVIAGYASELIRIESLLLKESEKPALEQVTEFDEIMLLLTEKKELIRKMIRHTKIATKLLLGHKHYLNFDARNRQKELNTYFASIMLLLESYEGVLINEIVAYLKNRTLTEYVKQEKIICKDIFRQVELLSQTLHLQKKSVTAQIITGFNLSSDILYTSAGLLVGASFLLFATTLIYTNGDEAIPSIKVLLDIKKSAGF